MSSLCTMPGRSFPPMPERSWQWCSRPCTRVPWWWPAAGCTTRPGGLLTTTRSPSSYMISRSMGSGARSRGSGSGRRTSTSQPACRRRAGRAGAWSTIIRPSDTRRCTWERDNIPSRVRCTYWSRRSPTASGGTVSLCSWVSVFAAMSQGTRPPGRGAHPVPRGGPSPMMTRRHRDEKGDQAWKIFSSSLATSSSLFLRAMDISLTSSPWAVSSILRSPKESSLSALSR